MGLFVAPASPILTSMSDEEGLILIGCPIFPRVTAFSSELQRTMNLTESQYRQWTPAIYRTRANRYELVDFAYCHA
jgi:hypothetical protein